MKTLQSRGKSKSHIRMELVQVYPYFRDEIYGLIAEMDEFSSLREQIDKYLQKYNIRIPAENKKFYDALLRKGFHYGDIKKLLSSENG
jgi:SOS response regulatory protein OraA/RecX